MRERLDGEAMPRQTVDRLLDVAERLTQTRGFNGFSYADIAAEVGITKASLHYHVRTKGELGERLIARYAENFEAALTGIDAESQCAPQKLAAYVRLYADVMRGERMCLCGMLAAEHSTLPGAVQDAIRLFFDANEEWLSAVAESGRQEGTLRFEGNARDVARLLLAALQGAMLVARPYGDPERFEAAAAALMAGLRA